MQCLGSGSVYAFLDPGIARFLEDYFNIPGTFLSPDKFVSINNVRTSVCPFRMRWRILLAVLIGIMVLITGCSNPKTPVLVPVAPEINSLGQVHLTALDPIGAQLAVVFTTGSTGGDAITNYEYTIDNGDTWVVREPASVESPLVITGLTNGQTYNIRIRAVNAFGAGAASNMMSGTPDVYEVGDTGPGGGIIFYVHPNEETFDCGPSLNLTCRYLEAWTTDLGSGRVKWSGNTTTQIPFPGAAGTAIGTGHQNTVTAVTLVAGGATPNKAVTLADSFSNNGFIDWYLPSKDEIAEMQITRHVIGGFMDDWYWSSSEVSQAGVWKQAFSFSELFDQTGKAEINRMRPIRAF